MMTSQAEASAAVYAVRRPGYEKAANKLRELLSDMVETAGVDCIVTARAKSVKSFEEKCEKRKQNGSGPSLKYLKPFEDITDLVAGRVITYVADMVDQVCAEIQKNFILHEIEDKGAQTRERGKFGYASKHFVAELGPAQQNDSANKALQGLKFEIQVRTVAQHAWAQFEHKIRYKGECAEGTQPEVDRQFLLAAALAEVMDGAFAEVSRLVPGKTAEVAEPTIVTGASLRRYLAKHYPEAGYSRPIHYDWIAGLLVRKGIGTLEALGSELQKVDHTQVMQAIGYQSFERRPGHVRCLDDDLLQALRWDWIKLSQTEMPSDKTRLSNLHARRTLLEKAGIWRAQK